MALQELVLRPDLARIPLRHSFPTTFNPSINDEIPTNQRADLTWSVPSRIID